MQKDNLLLEFRLSNLARGLSSRTIEYYDSNLKMFFDSGVVESIDEITPTVIRSFLASKRNLVSPSTLHIYYRVLRRFFNFLKEEEYLTDSPMDKMRPPKLPKLEPRYLSRDEIKRFFGAINTKNSIGFRHYSFFLFLLDTGARLSEALNLRMDNLDLENARAFIRGKGAKERYIFFGHRCSRFLAKYIFHHRATPIGEDFVFLSSTGRRIHQNNAYRSCKRIAKRAGLKNVHPHCLDTASQLNFWKTEVICLLSRDCWATVHSLW
jgi:site-specific recombinase XerD